MVQIPIEVASINTSVQFSWHTAFSSVNSSVGTLPSAQ